MGLVGGCAIEATGAPDHSSTSVQHLGDECQGLVCPGNSDLYAALETFELSTNPLDVSQRGFTLTGVEYGGHAMTELGVTGTMPSALDPDWGLRSGAAFVGAILHVHHNSGEDIDLRIERSTTVPYYAELGLPIMYGYWITYRTVGDARVGWRDICPYKTSYDAGVQGTWAMFWKGDRYDPDSGVIYATGSDVGPWFNLSCAGEATIKMLRTGTGYAVAPNTPLDQHNATLNMFTAKYCQEPDRYTTLGVAIDWDDKTGSNTLDPMSTIEAIWSKDGAVCLNTMRFPKMGPVQCPLAACSEDQIANWQDYGWLRSGSLK
jgi:hypothetical protein